MTRWVHAGAVKLRDAGICRNVIYGFSAVVGMETIQLSFFCSGSKQQQKEKNRLLGLGLRFLLSLARSLAVCSAAFPPSSANQSPTRCRCPIPCLQLLVEDMDPAPKGGTIYARLSRR
jgi:hypothetical protein